MAVLPQHSPNGPLAADDSAAPLLSVNDGITIVPESYQQLTGWQRWSEKGAVAAFIATVLTLGAVLGLNVPDSYSPLPHGAAKISNVIGWTYFWTWSLSFYPQLYVNWRRRSVVGLSFDFVLYNLIGFVCYAVYCCILFTSATVRGEYARRNHGKMPGVRLNDVVFSIHAVAGGLVTLGQIAMYDRGSQVFSRVCQRVVAALLLGISATLGAALWDALPIEPLDFLYLIGYIKVAITIVKYLPQVLLSYSRKSTVGFAVGPVICDFTGGVLSVAQQVFDAVILLDAAIVTGNPAKLLVGFVGMAYNIVMITQHYVLYPGAGKAAGSGQRAQHEPGPDDEHDKMPC